MMRLSRCLRVTGLASLPVLLLAATWAPLLQDLQQFDEHQFQVNERRWRALPEARREALRHRWQDFSQLSEEDRELHAQRMAVLREMTTTLRRILGREPTSAELAFQLGQVTESLQAWLADECGLAWPVDTGTLRSAMERELSGRIDAFLAGLVADGRLSAGEASRILAQEPSLLIRDALRLHAGEQQRGGSEQLVPATGGGAGTDRAGIAGQLQRSEREALENSRAPAVRGAPGGDPDAVDPLRLRMLKLAFIVDQLRAKGLSEREIQDHIMKSITDLQAVVERELGER